MLKTLKPRLTELGKIKIGRKEERARTSRSGNEWHAPEKLDHFLVTSMERDAVGNYKPDSALMQKLAAQHASDDGKLRELPIALLSDDPDEILQARYCYYAGKKLAATCDGETLTAYTDQSGSPLAVAKTRPCNGEHDADGWKLHAKFSCVIASAEGRWGGVYTLRTTSQITAEQLLGGLVHIASLTGGVLQGLPLRLVVRPMEVAPDGKPTTVHVVHVELRGADLGEIQRQAVALATTRVQNARQLQTLQADYRRLLKAPGAADEPAEEQADVNEEFSPETIDPKTGEVTIQRPAPAGPPTIPAQATPVPSTPPVPEAPQTAPATAAEDDGFNVPDEPAPATTPAANPDFERLTSRISGMKGKADHLAVGAEIRAALKAKKITEAEREALRALFQTAMKAPRSTPAPAPAVAEPPTTPAAAAVPATPAPQAPAPQASQPPAQPAPAIDLANVPF